MQPWEDTDQSYLEANHRIMPAYVQGDSAYQIALNNGFVGTEQQWLASLQGGGEIVPILKMVRYNDSLGRLEYYSGSQWLAVPGFTPAPPPSVFPLPLPFVLGPAML